MAAKHVLVSSHYVRVMRMLITVLNRLTDFFTGAIIETRKAARSKEAVSPPASNKLTLISYQDWKNPVWSHEVSTLSSSPVLLNMKGCGYCKNANENYGLKKA